MKILTIGDVVSEAGVKMLRRRLPGLRKELSADFVVANGENACGVGITPREAETIYRAGADVITLGNHTYKRQEIKPFLDQAGYMLRPLNFAPRAPGRGVAVYELGFTRVRVINLIGRCFMDFGPDNPFDAADRALSFGEADVTVVDFHAQATSEKEALGYYLDGRVAVFFGTHTHVQTADEKVLPAGTGYISDLGMTGPRHSVLGVLPEDSIAMFRGEQPGRLRGAAGPCYLCGALFDVDEVRGRCKSVTRVQITEDENG